MNIPSQAQKTRFNWIDQIKGLAILSIVLFHFFQNYPDRIQLISVLDINGAKLGYAAVDIFFVMAGFNTSYALVSKLKNNQINQLKTDWKSWLSKRLYRIYPPYILALILSCLLYYLFGYSQLKFTLNFILSFIGLAGIKFQVVNPGFWFFTVILEAYLLTPVIFSVCKNNPKKILLLGTIGAIITKFIAFYFFSVHNRPAYLFFLQNNFLGSYLFQLCLGIYWGFFYAQRQAFRKIDFVVSSIIFCIGFGLYAILDIAKIDIIYMLGFDVIFTPLFFLGIQIILIHLDKLAKLGFLLTYLSTLGIYSYQIYLIHQPLYFVLLPRLNQVIQLSPYLKIGFSLIIMSIMLTIYTFLFIKMEQVVMKVIGNIMIKQT